MIPRKRAFQLTVCLTLGLLAACEPLAPQQTPQVIVVTGVTENAPAVEANGLLEAALGVRTPPAADRAAGVVNTPVPTPTTTAVPTLLPSATPFGCGEVEGRIVQAAFPSEILGTDVPYTLVLPPCFYQTWRRYPYVILLHGTGYDEQMWLDLGVAEALNKGIRNGTLPPMVLVMPDGGDLAERNDAPVEQSWEAVILGELIPTLESFETGYCLWGASEGRAIGGISRGGFWAFSIALRHPDLFSALGGHSPHFDPDNAPAGTNPLDLAARSVLSKFLLRIWIDNAAADYVGANAEAMSRTLQARGIVHDYVIYPTGDHDMAYWTAHVSEYLAFYGQGWPADVTRLPSCEEANPS